MTVATRVPFGLLVWLPLLAVGCADAGLVTPDAASPGLQALSDDFVELDPQPKPPGSTFRFVVVLEEDDGEWFGTFGDGESVCGSAALTDPTLSDAGEITHLSFQLRLATHDDSWRVGADLSGIMNRVNGQLVLNGETTSGSLSRARVHQNGTILDPGGEDPLRFLGELMLRPQPEPPGRTAGPTYPPNPC